ncbi:DUF4838 domain-containing protein [Membranicola marinus]|uniref:DUF4838 domain-containing protein n=1 Tax=Membranihabitans marinus TaxID=1227546 RepID=A0A953HVF5_9BACT|nr:DUF4838 domain-containing protein [Membranihabitans marinus]MBY5959180.1 DUF4838 domain-containing protein [Membranihabitans marinus]
MKSKNIKTYIPPFVVIFCLHILAASCGVDTEKQRPPFRLGNNDLNAIAISSNASEREKFAADELIDYFYKITDEKIPLIQIRDSIIPEGVIAVGNLAIESGIIARKELDSVTNDGFIIRINENNGVLCGWRDLGTVYGAYELLSRLGVKIYAQDCEIVPRKSIVMIPGMNLSIKPHYDLRSIFKMDVYYPGFQSYLKLGYSPNDDLGYHGDLGVPGERNWVHSASYLMPYQKFGKEHPEFFALKKDGQRYNGVGAPGHLCMSNMKMRAVGAERLLSLVEQQKDRSYFVVTAGDGGPQNWCQCAECKAFDAKPGVHMTDRLMDYVNYNARKVTEKFPDKKILTLAYGSASASPPERIGPDSNVMVMYAPLHRPEPNYDGECHSHGLDCFDNLWAKEDIESWLSFYPDNMYIFDYPRNYYRWYQPFGSFYAMVDKMNYYATKGIRGITFCVVPANFRNLFLYVMAQLLWEPDSNVEDLIDEFMSVYYGTAAPDIREYFDFMYNEIDVRDVHQHSEKSNPALVTPEFSNLALEMFERAQKAVAQDSVLLSRVEFEMFSVLWADIDQRNTLKNNLSIDLATHAKRFGELVRIAKEHKMINVGGRVGFKEWVQQVSPIRLQNELWYNDPAIDVFISDPENLFQYN